MHFCYHGDMRWHCMVPGHPLLALVAGVDKFILVSLARDIVKALKPIICCLYYVFRGSMMKKSVSNKVGQAYWKRQTWNAFGLPPSDSGSTSSTALMVCNMMHPFSLCGPVYNTNRDCPKCSMSFQLNVELKRIANIHLQRNPVFSLLILLVAEYST